MELPGSLLGRLPSLARGGGSSLGSDQRVDASGELSERVLHVAALSVASTQEGSVEDNEDPRSALEEDGRQENAEPEKDLERRDNRHGSIVVLLDESTNLVSEWAVNHRSAAGRRTLGLGLSLGRKEGGNQVGAGVGSNVEHRVDRVGKQSEGVLGGKEPHKGHDWEMSASSCCEIRANPLANVVLTEVLNVLIGKKGQRARSRASASLCSRAQSLVDDNAIGGSSGDEGSPIRELGHTRVIVHSEPREAISNRGNN